MQLKCVKCEGNIAAHGEKCVCVQCSSEWPVTGGIPRFCEEPGYRGELGHDEAREMLNAARSGAWADAVRWRFAGNKTMLLELLDLQRASWAPMLGLGEKSVALDIGCGFGAITHSISRWAGEVYAVDAVPERIEFTQERLRQEGITNVRCVQASALVLPFADEMFDVVVANGILERVGEWDREGEPRDAQLKFLRRINRLLKKDGVFVAGSESRFGHARLRGGRDRSGIAHTSRVPRRAYSFMLSHSSATRRDVEFDSPQKYQTCTYSERGYRKLLSQAAFTDISCYWASPGYGQPYHLIPTDAYEWIRERVLYSVDHPGPAPQRSWRRRLKRSLARPWLIRVLANDFVFIASKMRNRQMKVNEWLGANLGHGPLSDPAALRWELHTGPFATKWAGKVTGPRGAAVLKVWSGCSGVARESQNHTNVGNMLREAPHRLISVPRTLGELRVANISYHLESVARGRSVASLVREPGRFKNMRTVWPVLGSAVAGAIEATRALQNLCGVMPIDPGWLSVPKEIGDSEDGIRSTIEMARYFGDGKPNAHTGWIQHGDLSVENLFLNQKTGEIEVLDWADLAAGFPPLYDVFALLFSTVYLTPADKKKRFSNEEERWIASFKAIFLDETKFALIVRDWMLNCCEKLNVQAALLPSLLLEFLLVRSHYYRSRSPVYSRVYLQLLRHYAERKSCIFGMLPIMHALPRAAPKSAQEHQAD